MVNIVAHHCHKLTPVGQWRTIIRPQLQPPCCPKHIIFTSNVKRCHNIASFLSRTYHFHHTYTDVPLLPLHAYYFHRDFISRFAKYGDTTGSIRAILGIGNMKHFNERVLSPTTNVSHSQTHVFLNFYSTKNSNTPSLEKITHLANPEP